MSRKSARQCFIFLLALLLPLQAALAAPLSLCAALQKASHNPAAMTHCGEMKPMTLSVAADNAVSPLHPSSGCWLGSVCVAGMAAFAMPVQQLPASMERGSPLYHAPVTYYHSVVTDLPQRPPALS